MNLSVEFLMKEIEELKIENSKLKELCSRDYLTGLLNRKILDEINDSKYKYIMIDIDDFKIINDNHGHLVGDKIIKLVADCLTESFRKTDKIIRYGGDEFCVILNLKEDNIINIIEKRMENFQYLLNEKVEEKLNINISFGIGNNLKEADDALYKSKRNKKIQKMYILKR